MSLLFALICFITFFQAEYGDIYRNISIGANIDGFEAYRCVGVGLVGGN